MKPCLWVMPQHSNIAPAAMPCCGQCRHRGNPDITPGHFSQLPLCCCQISCQHLQVGIFSTGGNPSRTGDVEEWEERKGNKSSSRNKADIFEWIPESLAKALSLALGVLILQAASHLEQFWIFFFIILFLNIPWNAAEEEQLDHSVPPHRERVLSPSSQCCFLLVRKIPWEAPGVCSGAGPSCPPIPLLCSWYQHRLPIHA